MKLYGAQFCPKCRAIEKYLKESNISFEKIDATTLSQEELSKKNISQIPMIEMDGENIFYAGDMSKTKLLQLIGK